MPVPEPMRAEAVRLIREAIEAEAAAMTAQGVPAHHTEAMLALTRATLDQLTALSAHEASLKGYGRIFEGAFASAIVALLRTLAVLHGPDSLDLMNVFLPAVNTRVALALCDGRKDVQIVRKGKHDA